MVVRVHQQKLKNGLLAFSLQITQAGKRRYAKIGGVGLHADPNHQLSYTRALRFAEDARAKRQVELASAATGLHAAHYIPHSDDLITYMQRLATTYSGNTHRTWLDAISALRRYTHNVPLQSITRDYLESLQRTMLASGLQPGTVRTYLVRVSIALNHAVRDSLIASNPMHTIKLVKPPLILSK